MHSRIYQITETKPVEISENEIAEYASSWCVDYVVMSEDERDMDWLKENMPSVKFTLEEDGCYSFELTDEVKKAYFCNTYDKFKELVDSISLKDFATDDITAYRLRKYVTDDYAFKVIDNDCYQQPMDAWMRCSKNGKYYVGKTVYDYHF